MKKKLIHPGIKFYQERMNELETLDSICQKVPYSKAHLNAILRGRSNISPGVSMALAKVYHLPDLELYHQQVRYNEELAKQEKKEVSRVEENTPETESEKSPYYKGVVPQEIKQKIANLASSIEQETKLHYDGRKMTNAYVQKQVELCRQVEKLLRYL